MSAAEKLKAVQAIHLSVGDPPVNQWALYDVPLPQIVAVVEALQRTNQHLDGYIGYESHELIGMNAAALAALDEALT